MGSTLKNILSLQNKQIFKLFLADIEERNLLSKKIPNCSIFQEMMQRKCLCNSVN